MNELDLDELRSLNFGESIVVEGNNKLNIYMQVTRVFKGFLVVTYSYKATGIAMSTLFVKDTDLVGGGF